MEEKCCPAVLNPDENCIINGKDENFTGEVCFPQLIAAAIEAFKKMKKKVSK